MTENEINSEAAIALREESGMTQKEFWGPIGVQQSVSSRYESGHNPIPQSVRILLVARYVSGIKIDASSHEGIEELSRLASIQSKHNQAKVMAGTIRTDLAKAIKNLETARDALHHI